MAGSVVGDLAQPLFEVGFQPAFLVPQHEVFEGVVEGGLHLFHVGIVREQQRQFLLEHEHAGGDEGGEVPAGIHPFRQLRNVEFLGFDDGVEVAQFQLGHPATAFLFHQRHRDAVVCVDRREVLADAGFIAVHIAGGEQGDLTLRAPGGLARSVARQPAQTRAQRLAGKLGQPGFGVDFRHGFHRSPHRAEFIHRIDHLGDHRNAGQAADGVGAGEDAVAQFSLCRTLAFFELHHLGAQHQVREIQVPRMRRHIGAFGHVAKVAEEAVVDDFPVIGLRHPIDFHRLAAVHQIEQGGEGLAQADATAAAVADVEHPLHFLVEGCLVMEIGIAPVEWMASGGFEIAFAAGDGHGGLLADMTRPSPAGG